jgi:uncharacterized protein (DUF58 family)
MTDHAATLLDPHFLKKLENLSLASKRAFAGQMQGEKRSPKRGSSVEFADYREYALGDDLRYVDWKAYGRLEKLFLKLFVAEQDLSLHLLIDTSRSMEFGAPLRKIDYALRVAAALGYIALTNYDRVSVAGFSDTLSAPLPPLRGKPSIAAFLRYLQQQNTGGETRFGDALTLYARRAKNSGIAVVVSDYFDSGYARGIKALLAKKFQIVLIHVLDSEEISPTLTGDLRLIDAESGDAHEVSISPVLLDQYRSRLQSFCGEIKNLAARYGMDYVQASTNVPFEDVILKFLRRQNLLR